MKEREYYKAIMREDWGPSRTCTHTAWVCKAKKKKYRKVTTTSAIVDDDNGNGVMILMIWLSQIRYHL